jgi:type II secretory pathway pseudopilin PulG
MLKNLNKNKFKYLYPNITKGFTLAEVLVAIFILVTGIIGVSFLITNTISSVNHSSKKLVAAYLAQEGIEIARNIRDTNWLQHQANPTNPWDDGLTVCQCTCDDMSFDGACVVDYMSPMIADPILEEFDATHDYLNNSSGFYSYSAGSPTKFKRKIVILPDGDVLHVCVRVEWEERGISYHVMAREDLYNWFD